MISPYSSFVVLMTTLLLLPLTLASATAQFKLNPITDASSCWMECHSIIAHSSSLPGIPINSETYIDRNCRNEPYPDLMSTCLVSKCDSVPDVVYAVEYGESICRRAGVAIEIKLPEGYVAAASDYFQSEAYTSRGTKGIKNWGFDWMFIAVFMSLVTFVLA